MNHEVPVQREEDRWYLLDAEDRIVSVSKDWNAFALENGGESAVAAKIIGQSLWSFIDCTETQSYLSSLFFYCRGADSEICMTYRCDSPGVQRLFRMQIEPLPNRGIMIRHYLLYEKTFSEKNLDLSRPVLRRCTQCNDLSIADQMNDVDINQLLPITKIEGYVCTDCKLSALAEMGSEASQVMKHFH